MTANTGSVRMSIDTATKRRGISSLRLASRSLMVFALSAALLFTSACSGGGGFNPPLNALSASITSVQTVTTASGESAVRIDFSVTGETGQQFTLLFQYFIDADMDGQRDANEPLLTMTEVSMALENLLVNDPNNPQPPSMGDVSGFGPNTDILAGAFFWQAGADLGFSVSNFGVVITPTGSGNQTVNPASSAGSFTYGGGNPSASVTGSAGGAAVSGTGRAQHAAHLVSDQGTTATMTDVGNEIAALQGTDGSAPIGNIDRLSIDGNTRTAALGAGFMGSAVVEHATAPIYEGTTVRVLSTGGANSSGTAQDSCTLYLFGPTGAESVNTSITLNTARRRHAACWLPSNEIFVCGGLDAAGNPLASAEIFDPATSTFSNVAMPMPGPRFNHTCTLLPDGTVLIAGGSSSTTPTAGNAFIFDPSSGGFTDTGASVDRYDHTANLLVNGAVILAGGRTVSGDVPLATADFYRSIDGGPGAPVGFTSITAANMSGARYQHAASILGDGSLLVSGGFGPGNSALATSEFFMVVAATSTLTIGVFSPTNPMATPGLDMVAARARHTQTTTVSGSAVVLGGVTGSEMSPSVITDPNQSIEIFQFMNNPPSVSNINAGGSLSAVNLSFTLADVEGNPAYVIVRFSTDGGATFGFATLTNYAATVNLQPGTHSVTWNAMADGVASLSGTVVEVIPVGGPVGAPAGVTLP